MPILYYCTRTSNEMKVSVKFIWTIHLHIILNCFGPSVFLWCYQPINIVRIFLSCNSRMISHLQQCDWLTGCSQESPRRPHLVWLLLPLRWMRILTVYCLWLYRHSFVPPQIRSWMFGAYFNPTLTDQMFFVCCQFSLSDRTCLCN